MIGEFRDIDRQNVVPKRNKRLAVNRPPSPMPDGLERYPVTQTGCIDAAFIASGRDFAE